ncbi:hypothetical protein DPMN_027907 [Dreissena polymorpha]|uniref:Uncharacterized protein n=1 Tax=Dreissena polymorpha TaxID=45954 RepID=A0A9D4LVN8_DREPO|nr:hypothetical protein DPMN_027907 [Dreissena polymorpha]
MITSGIGLNIISANTPIFSTTTYTSGSSTILDTTSGSVSIGTVTFTNADCATTTSITMNSNSYFTFVDNRNGTGLCCAAPSGKTRLLEYV